MLHFLTMQKDWILLTVVSLLSLATTQCSHSGAASDQKQSQGGQAGGGRAGRGGQGGGGATPVSASPVQMQDMPIYLRGLGTVTAFNTVAVKSRVDGPLVRITFQEGQNVKEGMVLPEIDP